MKMCYTKCHWILAAFRTLGCKTAARLPSRPGGGDCGAMGVPPSGGNVRVAAGGRGTLGLGVCRADSCVAPAARKPGSALGLTCTNSLQYDRRRGPRRTSSRSTRRQAPPADPPTEPGCSACTASTALRISAAKSGLALRNCLGVLAALAQADLAEAEPRPLLLDDVLLDAQVQQVARRS